MVGAMAGSPAAQLHHALGDEDHTLMRGQVEAARAGAGPLPGTRPATGVSAEVVGAPSTWGKLAACAGEWSVFFGARGERSDTRDRREARAGAICATCSMRAPCREWAREHREYGYWGGVDDLVVHGEPPW